MNFLSWGISFGCAILALDTVRRMWTERHRFGKEVLSEQDRAFAWKIVLFLVFPLMTLADLRATEVAASYFGAYINRPVWGLVWYEGQLGGLNHIQDLNALFLVVFAGALVQIAFALLLATTLFLRPHPFLATLIGYTTAFTLGVNLVFEPILSLSGMGSWGIAPRVEVLIKSGTEFGVWWPLLSQIGGACLYLTALVSPFVRSWFASLTRPLAHEELAHCLKEWQGHKEDQELTCQLGLAYVKSGLLFKARSLYQAMKKDYPGSPYTELLGGVLSFQRRKYKEARLCFERLANHPAIGAEFLAQIFAAAACSAFAEQSSVQALNLAERALEFDDACLTARMVKVDVYLAEGKKDAAAQEIFVAMHLGLDFDLKDKIPIDSEKALIRLKAAIESQAPGTAENPAQNPDRELVSTAGEGVKTEQDESNL